MRGGHPGDSDEEAQTPDTLSALVKVSSLKNEINKLVMERVRGETSPSPPALGKNLGKEMDCSD